MSDKQALKESSKVELNEDVLPVPPEARTLGFGSIFTIWFAINFVITTTLTGMLFVPDLSVGTVMVAISLGSLVGAIPLALIAIIGSKTGLNTMTALRGAFGTRGASIPAIFNILILVGWSWAQAGLGGSALDYLATAFFGYSNWALFTVITEVLVVSIAMYAVDGISVLEKVATVMVLVMIGLVLYRVAPIGVGAIISNPPTNTSGLTAIGCFDIGVATALSFTPMAADYGRSVKTGRDCALGTGIGYAVGTSVNMCIGAIMIGALVVGGMELTYEPAHVYGQLGLGIPGSVMIFMSILATNTPCIYSIALSTLSVVPKLSFKKALLIVGVLCTVGAVFSNVLDVFLNFVNLIAVLFMPVFAIMIADFFILKHGGYDVDALVYTDVFDEYSYSGGLNFVALVVYVLMAVLAYVLSYVHPIAIGSNIPVFVLTLAIYVVAMRAFGNRRDATGEVE